MRLYYKAYLTLLIALGITTFVISSAQAQCTEPLFTPIQNNAPSFNFNYNFTDFNINHADFNGDSLNDIIYLAYIQDIYGGNISIIIVKNISTGKLPSQVKFDTGFVAFQSANRFDSRYIDYKVADVNNDGKPDIVIFYGNLDTAKVLLNTSVKDTIRFIGSPDVALLHTAQHPSSLKVADFNNDGKKDLIYVGTDGELYVALNFMDTSFHKWIDTIISTGIVMDTPTYYSNSSYALGDLNNDSLPDIVLTGSNDKHVYIYKNTSSGTHIQFSLVQVDTLPDSLNTIQFWEGNSVQIQDLDNDGKADISILYETSNNKGGLDYSKIALLKNNSIGRAINISFSDTINLSRLVNLNKYPIDSSGDTLSNYTHATFSDFALVHNGGTNKRPDILLTVDGLYQSNSCLGFMANISDSTGIHYSSPCWFMRAVADRIDAGDFNNDGKDDILAICDVCIPGVTIFGLGMYINESTSAMNNEPEVITPNSLRLYPNPTTGDIRIASPSQMQQVQVINITGEMVRNIDVSTGNYTTLSLKDLSNGLYYIRIVTKEGVQVEKVVKVF